MTNVAAQVTANKDVVSRAISEVVGDGNFENIEEYYAADMVHYGGPIGQSTGPAAFQEWMEEVHAAFPDFEATEEFSICEDDLVASRLTYTGTHEGEFMDVPATGKRVEVTGNTFNRIEEGKIVESWPVTDFLGVLQQIGALEGIDA